MVNTTGGKQHKKAKKHRVVPNQNSDSQVTMADTNQVYALVKKKAGGSRIIVECSDNKERSAIIPGRFFKKLWFNPGDILLCSLDIEGDDSICHIEHKYTSKDANTLKFQGKMSFDVMDDKKENKGFKFIEGSKMNNNNNTNNNPQNDGSSVSSDDIGVYNNPNRPIKKNISDNRKKSNKSDSDSSSQTESKKCYNLL